MSDDPNELDPTELPSTEAAPSPADAHEPIGPYRRLQKLGEGGMGEVWLADQTEPVKRRVALKIIKQGMDTKQVVARFEAERQALAMMDHPAVAKVFDAGTTPRGRPFFVMEYVKGVPITEHCDRHKLTTHERLKLFCEVCEGVQHAHQKAIIHRDLKPSNVLVTEHDGKRLPKIIDFGVAKATAQKLTEKTVYTELGVLIGTPEYMSPEQADLTGEDVDTRTDVYSLGVMLYELLVGALPFDSKELRSGGYEGIRKKIREEEPHRPSTRLSTLGDRSTESAKCRRVDLPTLQRQLRGDLDWITMRALEKDRSRRYGSPMEFAADIERYLADEPVLASPPSVAYRARKFVRRHRVGVLAAAASAVVLIGFALTMAVQARRIAAERDRAEQAKADLETVVEFQTGMLSNMDTEEVGRRLMEDLKSRFGEAARGRGLSETEVQAVVRSFEDAGRGVNPTDVALRLIDEEILARAVETLEAEFAEQPLIEAQLRKTIGATYTNLGLYPEAEPQLLRALEIRKRVLGEADPDTLDSMRDLEGVYGRQARWTEAEALSREVLETQKRVLGDDHSDTLDSMYNLAYLYVNQGRNSDDVEALALETLETSKRVLGNDDPGSLRAMHLLAVVYTNQGRYDEAERLLLEVLETQRRVLGDDHEETLFSIGLLAFLYRQQARYTEAEELMLEAVETSKRVLGDEHQTTIMNVTQLNFLYQALHRYDEAEALSDENLETQKRVLGDDHPFTLRAAQFLANVWVNQGRYEEAERLSLETLETWKRVLGDDHSGTNLSRNSLVALYIQQRRYDEAEVLLVEALEIQKRVRGGDHQATHQYMYNLACLDALRGDREKAMGRLRRVIESGYAAADGMSRDPDLESLHGPEFDTLLERARENAAAHRAD